MAIYFHHKRAL